MNDQIDAWREQVRAAAAAGGHLAIRGGGTKALYGRAEAIIPAARLCDGEFIRADILPEARFVTLRFEGPEVIYAGGMELACAPVTVDA